MICQIVVFKGWEGFDGFNLGPFVFEKNKPLAVPEEKSRVEAMIEADRPENEASRFEIVGEVEIEGAGGHAFEVEQKTTGWSVGDEVGRPAELSDTEKQIQEFVGKQKILAEDVKAPVGSLIANILQAVEAAQEPENEKLRDYVISGRSIDMNSIRTISLDNSRFLKPAEVINGGDFDRAHDALWNILGIREYPKQYLFPDCLREVGFELEV